MRFALVGVFAALFTLTHQAEPTVAVVEPVEVDPELEVAQFEQDQVVAEEQEIETVEQPAVRTQTITTKRTTVKQGWKKDTTHQAPEKKAEAWSKGGHQKNNKSWGQKQQWKTTEQGKWSNQKQQQTATEQKPQSWSNKQGGHQNKHQQKDAKATHSQADAHHQHQEKPAQKEQSWGGNKWQGKQESNQHEQKAHGHGHQQQEQKQSHQGHGHGQQGKGSWNNKQGKQSKGHQHHSSNHRQGRSEEL